MKFSVIIPTLNEEKLLAELLKYLTDERKKYDLDFEIIVSDGASTDKTREVAIAYCDKLIVHDNETKQTISDGRNKGAENAEGDIFIFINGDVKLENFKSFLGIVEKDMNTDKYIAWTCQVNIAPEERTFEDKLYMGFYNRYFHLLNIIGLGMGRGECHVMKGDVFHKFGGYNAKIVAGEDFEFYKRLSKKGKIKFSTEFTIFESPRRYRKKGHFNILMTWLLNSLFVMFKKRSMSQQWEEVR